LQPVQSSSIQQSTTRFGQLVTDNEIVEARMKAVSKKKQLTESNKSTQAHWLTRLILEVRKNNGTE